MYANMANNVGTYAWEVEAMIPCDLKKNVVIDMQIELFCSKELPWLLQIKEKKLQYLAEKENISSQLLE